MESPLSGGGGFIPASVEGEAAAGELTSGIGRDQFLFTKG
jgi:hypothetical protein